MPAERAAVARGSEGNETRRRGRRARARSLIRAAARPITLPYLYPVAPQLSRLSRPRMYSPSLSFPRKIPRSSIPHPPPLPPLTQSARSSSCCTGIAPFFPPRPCTLTSFRRGFVSSRKDPGIEGSTAPERGEARVFIPRLANTTGRSVGSTVTSARGRGDFFFLRDHEGRFCSRCGKVEKPRLRLDRRILVESEAMS